MIFNCLAALKTFLRFSPSRCAALLLFAAGAQADPGEAEISYFGEHSSRGGVSADGSLIVASDNEGGTPIRVSSPPAAGIQAHCSRV